MELRTTPAPGDGPFAGPPTDDTLMTPAEVAALFRVDPKTVTRWATAGKLMSLRTLGGHRRYHAGQVRALLDEARGAPRDASSRPTVDGRRDGHAPVG